MNHKKQLSLFGLKWNPFIADLPPEALIETEKVTHFAWKVENLVMDGGFALVTGDPGTGKSVILRILYEKLSGIRDIRVGILTRPQSSMADFYRELGNIFDIELKTSNRFGGYKTLRERWKMHIESTLFRPVLIIDEAQEMPAATLTELRQLSSMDFDSKNILTVILCGDQRLKEKFRSPDLLPLGSRIRTRFTTEPVSKPVLLEHLRESTKRAGNPNLLTEELEKILVDHAAGNYRILTTMADEILKEGISQDKNKLDEKLFFDVYQPKQKRSKGK